MAKYYILNLVKKNFKSKPEVRISAEVYIENKGEKVQMIGWFEERDEAELALKVKGAKTLRGYWGKSVHLEYRNGTIGFSNVERRRTFFVKFIR